MSHHNPTKWTFLDIKQLDLLNWPCVGLYLHYLSLLPTANGELPSLEMTKIEHDFFVPPRDPQSEEQQDSFNWVFCRGSKIHGLLRLCGFLVLGLSGPVRC